MSKQTHYERILSAANTLFYEKGFHDCGTQDVVNLAGVSKGSFYNHFKSKDSLGLAVLDSYWEGNAEIRERLHNSKYPPLERIHNYLDTVEYDKRGCLIGNFGLELASSDLFQQRISEIFNEWVSDLAACIEEGQKDGTIRKDESAVILAEFVISSMEGSILRAKVERDPKVLERFRKSISLFLKNNHA